MKKKVMVAVSGGVDSSVAAYLLKQQGYDVAGLTMKLNTFSNKGENADAENQDIIDAREVCDILSIPHYIEDFSNEIEELVIKPFIDEYKMGRTPNPCVICNKTIKFGLLLEKAKILGYDIIATGHYTRKAVKNDKLYIKRGKDPEKDQSYFLYTLTGRTLEQVEFPLGDYTKDDVRKIAEIENFPVTHKRESQDICFFSGENSTTFFESRKITGKPGDIIDLNGNVIGTHKGIIFYTIGQRRGLGVSAPDPLYVIGIDPGNNTIIVGNKKHLKSRSLLATVLNFNSDVKEGRASGKIRYAHKEAACEYRISNGELEVVFDELQEAITPGQSVVLYDDDLVLGGGIVNTVLDNTIRNQ